MLHDIIQSMAGGALITFVACAAVALLFKGK